MPRLSLAPFNRFSLALLSACVLALYASSAFAQDPFVSEVQHFDYDAKPALDK